MIKSFRIRNPPLKKKECEDSIGSTIEGIMRARTGTTNDAEVSIGSLRYPEADTKPN